MIKHTPIWIRTVALSMLLAMVYYFAGYRIVYYLITQNAKLVASADIGNKHAKLETLVFDKTQFAAIKWTEKNKEFSYEGQLYDVAGIAKTNDGVAITVYADKNETQWVKALDNFVKQLFPADHSKNSKNTESIIAACQTEYLPVNAVKIMSPDVSYAIYNTHITNLISYIGNTTTWRPPSC